VPVISLPEIVTLATWLDSTWVMNWLKLMSWSRELKRVEKEMLDAARNLEFERAAQLRDRLVELKSAMFGVALPDEV